MDNINDVHNDSFNFSWVLPSSWSLKNGEDVVTDHQEMADILNNFFVHSLLRRTWTTFQKLNTSGENQLTNVTFTKDNVKEKFVRLKRSAAPWQDTAWEKVLHILADVLDEPMSQVYSMLPVVGCVPNIWRTDNVCPVFKKGSKGDPGNYRPISLTCILCKVMDRNIRDAMNEFLLQNRLICSSQHNFLPGRSTLTNLLEYLETLTRPWGWCHLLRFQESFWCGAKRNTPGQDEQ